MGESGYTGYRVDATFRFGEIRRENLQRFVFQLAEVFSKERNVGRDLASELEKCNVDVLHNVEVTLFRGESGAMASITGDEVVIRLIYGYSTPGRWKLDDILNTCTTSIE
ncbi:hypothetical protein E3E38_06025 [Thermococcus sp. 18S1]|uniref:hypothetical protein n=1 Tax=Thermococcus sp. 18S1 TaxID=1638210 RepID=UPI00143C0672|nr:hypothetical protein [Thermococcus sp. 18S1]NJE30604.1 hypothetical protein [Thermococcus sp. 18S1]